MDCWEALPIPAAADRHSLAEEDHNLAGAAGSSSMGITLGASLERPTRRRPRGARYLLPAGFLATALFFATGAFFAAGAFFAVADGRITRVSTCYNLPEWIRMVGG